MPYKEPQEVQSALALIRVQSMAFYQLRSILPPEMAKRNMKSARKGKRKGSEMLYIEKVQFALSRRRPDTPGPARVQRCP